MDAQEIARAFLSSSAHIKQALSDDAEFLSLFASAGERLQQVVQSGGTIYSCGNGGSACDAVHFTEELTARYKRDRPGIRAAHFIDGAAITCWSNDYEYVSAFERQAKTFCRKGDALIAISTSGNSENIMRAAQVAKDAGAFVLGLSGKDGGKLKDLADVTLIVPSNETDRIQEVHITLIHALCELFERE